MGNRCDSCEWLITTYSPVLHTYVKDCTVPKEERDLGCETCYKKKEEGKG